YNLDSPGGSVSSVKATNDNSFLYLEITTASDLTTSDEFMVAFDTYLGNTGESTLPGGATVANRAEFLLTFSLDSDTALHHVTEAFRFLDALNQRIQSDLKLELALELFRVGLPLCFVCHAFYARLLSQYRRSRSRGDVSISTEIKPASRRPGGGELLHICNSGDSRG
ncbi:MAG: hypothetical protein ACWGQW_16665, partial [bacterium]